MARDGATGMVRTSLTVLPQRGLFATAKAVAFAAVAFGTGLLTSFTSFFVGQAIMSSHHLNITLTDPGVLRAVIGGALFLTGCGLLALGLGLIIRSSAGAITALAVLLFVLPVLVSFLPQDWKDHVEKWLPATAGGQIFTVIPARGGLPMFAPWTGFAVFCGYAVVALAAGLCLFRTRDA